MLLMFANCEILLSKKKKTARKEIEMQKSHQIDVAFYGIFRTPNTSYKKKRGTNAEKKRPTLHTVEKP